MDARLSGFHWGWLHHDRNWKAQPFPFPQDTMAVSCSPGMHHKIKFFKGSPCFPASTSPQIHFNKFLQHATHCMQNAEDFLSFELTAFLDYYTHFHPTIFLEELPTHSQIYPPTTAKVMGVFTTDLTICDHFFWAGTPVWLVRPFSALSSIHVRELTPVQTPKDFTPLTLAICPSHPTIYCGPGDHINKYQVIASHVLWYLQYSNPFWSIHTETSIVPLLHEKTSKHEICWQHYSPCRFLLQWPSIPTYMSITINPQKNSNIPKMPLSGWNKFKDLESPFLSPPTPSWQKALSDFTPRIPLPTVAESYVFPEPALLISVQNKKYQDAYFQSWLKLHTAMIY